jgi:hypothetical protein
MTPSSGPFLFLVIKFGEEKAEIKSNESLVIHYTFIVLEIYILILDLLTFGKYDIS